VFVARKRLRSRKFGRVVLTAHQVGEPPDLANEPPDLAEEPPDLAERRPVFQNVRKQG
jgi:hypothetical protein